MYFVRHKGPEEEEKAREKGLPISMTAPMMVLAALCIILGLFWLSDVPMPLINRILTDLSAGGRL